MYGSAAQNKITSPCCIQQSLLPISLTAPIVVYNYFSWQFFIYICVCVWVNIQTVIRRRPTHKEKWKNKKITQKQNQRAAKMHNELNCGFRFVATITFDMTGPNHMHTMYIIINRLITARAIALYLDSWSHVPHEHTISICASSIYSFRSYSRTYEQKKISQICEYVCMKYSQLKYIINSFYRILRIAPSLLSASAIVVRVLSFQHSPFDMGFNVCGFSVFFTLFCSFFSLMCAVCCCCCWFFFSFTSFGVFSSIWFTATYT